MPALKRKHTLNDFHAARTGGPRVPMLTCYDYTTARLMEAAGIPALLVGDSAANVILGHASTLPAPLSFMIQITAAVRRGAPLAFLTADMPFGSYHGSLGSAVTNVCKVVKQTGCDAVKLEVADRHAPIVQRLADAGVAVVAHLGLRPQSVGLMGGYKFQGRTADEAQRHRPVCPADGRIGAAALLLEAVPPEVSEAVVAATKIPVIGCGAGPACHGAVVVTQDVLGLTPTQPRFVPKLGDLAASSIQCFEDYARLVVEQAYPQGGHNYVMPRDEADRFKTMDLSGV